MYLLLIILLFISALLLEWQNKDWLWWIYNIFLTFEGTMIASHLVWIQLFAIFIFNSVWLI